MSARITLDQVNVGAEDPPALARFWAELAGATPVSAGEVSYFAAATPDGFGMFFQPLGRPRPAGGPLHLDLTVPWGTRTAEVERVLALGATWKWDVLDEYPHLRWTTLADPEGNLFCLAEHRPS